MEEIYIEIGGLLNLRVQQPDFGKKDIKYDALSGSKIFGKTKTITLGSSIYNAHLLAEYLISSRDLRELGSGALMSKDEIFQIAEMQDNLEIKEDLLALEPKESLPPCPQISATEFFFEEGELAVNQLLSACELENISNVQTLQKFFYKSWNRILQCLIGVLHNNPIKVIQLSLHLKQILTEAFNSCIDENSSLYVYEQTFLQPIWASTCVLLGLFTSGLFKFGSETNFVEAAYLLKPAILPI
jgi:hypothetical protein